jgi:hypothetical protein
MEHQVANLERRVRILETKISRCEGRDLHPRLLQMEERVRRNENTLLWLSGAAAGAGALFGSLIGFIVKMIH